MTERSINLLEITESAQSSALKIAKQNLKNRKLHKFIPTKIIDNFFESPSLWRNFALNQEYTLPTNGTWPGKRTDFLNTLDEESFDLLAKNLLKVLPQYRGFSSLWASFHLIDESYGNGWVHDDDPELTVSGIIYLNPKAPTGSGTILYNDQHDHTAKKYNDFFKQDVLFADEKERKNLGKYREEHKSFFTPNMVIENIYNRCIIFDPRVWHSPGNFFGTTDNDARLTLVFFAKAVI